MAMPMTRELIGAALQAGYRVLAVEHPRSTRWLLTLRDHAGTSILLVVQARPLISAADVQDLDELVRVPGWIVGCSGPIVAGLAQPHSELVPSLAPGGSRSVRPCHRPQRLKDKTAAQRVVARY